MKAHPQFRWLALISVAGLVCVSLAGMVGVAHAQSAIPIEYGQTVTGEIKLAAPNNAQLYSFTASAGDEISIVMTRTSGNLRPLAALADPTKTGSAEILGVTKTSTDGKTGTLASYTFESDGTFDILATHEGANSGTTTGKFSLTLTLLGGSPTDVPATNTPAPRPTTKPGKTPTKSPARKTPTPTPGASNVDIPTFTVGTSPGYSVWNGTNLFVANSGDGTVSILDGDGNQTGTIPVGGSPFAMAWDGTRLWVADIGTDSKPGTSVSVWDGKGKRIGAYKLGKQPFSLSYDTDDQVMWVALFGDDKVVSVNAKGKIVTTVDVSASGHGPNTVLWAGGQLWVTLSGTTDTPDNKVLSVAADGTINGTFDVGQAPADLAWDDADSLLFVPNSLDNTVTALDNTGAVQGTYNVGKNPVAITFDGKDFWVSLADDLAVEVLSPQGDKLSQFTLSTNPNGITYDGTSSIWVALQGSSSTPGNSVARLDTSMVGQ